MTSELRRAGAKVEELADGLVIEGVWATREPADFPLLVDVHGDHRIAMALAVAALGAEGDTEIAGAEVVSISLPGFFSELARGAAR